MYFTNLIDSFACHVHNRWRSIPNISFYNPLIRERRTMAIARSCFTRWFPIAYCCLRPMFERPCHPCPIHHWWRERCHARQYNSDVTWHSPLNFPVHPIGSFLHHLLEMRALDQRNFPHIGCAVWNASHRLPQSNDRPPETRNHWQIPIELKYLFLRM